MSRLLDLESFHPSSSAKPRESEGSAGAALSPPWPLQPLVPQSSRQLTGLGLLAGRDKLLEVSVS
jgi:hypothetical protein